MIAPSADLSATQSSGHADDADAYKKNDRETTTQPNSQTFHSGILRYHGNGMNFLNSISDINLSVSLEMIKNFFFKN